MRKGINSICMRIALFIILTATPFLLGAQTTADKEAEQFASRFLLEQKMAKTGDTETPALATLYRSADTVLNTVYGFGEEKSGFVFVVRDNNRMLAAGYSPDGFLDTTAMAPALRALISFYENTPMTVIADEDHAGAGAAKGDATVGSKGSSGTPLLNIDNIRWRQGAPYNAECPFDSDAGVHTLAGCVAVTMAQIMRYHKFPETGAGTHSYTHSKYGVISADFGGTTYQWNSMPGQITEPNQHIATIMFHAGAGAEMDYGVSGSAASLIKSRDAFKNFFRYSEARTIYSSSFIDDISYFYQVLRDEVDSYRPVFYELLGDVAHSVVLDGYDGDYFHLNFGWGGSHNGYYILDGETFDFRMRGNAIITISPVTIGINEQDSLALVAIYNSTGGDNWTRRGGWLTGEPVIEWQGVTVINGRVVKLDLAQNKLTGTIPPEIGNLSELRWLKLSNNAQLTGSLPAQTGNLMKLLTLDIDVTGLSGSIPPELGNITSLQRLSLRGNNFSGAIPDELFSLSSLIYLNLGQNSLTGGISPAIGQLGNLRYLSLWNNNFSGTLPDEIGDMLSIREFIVANNNFSGEIPGTIDAWSNIADFNLSDNAFTGALPDVGAGFTKLLELKISNNKFTALPPDMGNLSLLKLISAANNKIETLPPSVSALGELYRLDLIGNMLTTLPPLGAMPSLWDVRLISNRITSLPESFGDLTRITHLYLGDNRLTHLPASFEKLSTLKMLALNDNRLTIVPESFCFLGSLEQLLLMNNEISGVMPPLDFLGLNYIDIRGNNFVFSEIATSLLTNDTGQSGYTFNYHLQSKVPLTDSLLRFTEGESVEIDIRSISRLVHPGNSYTWYRNGVSVSTGPLLTIESFSADDHGEYYCSITNSDYPKLLVLETEPLTLTAGSEGGEFDGAVYDTRVTAERSFTDNQVLLTTADSLRGEIVWQASSDTVNWYDITDDIANAAIAKSIAGKSGNSVVVEPFSTLLFRYLVLEENCDPVVSDTITLMSYGELLADTLVNASAEVVTIIRDSIEVIIPAGFHDDDFRVVIKKLNEPPANSPATLASVYDVTVSIGTVFDIPLMIRLKNIDTDSFEEAGKDHYRPGYYDDSSQEWIAFERTTFSMKDSSLVFETKHLTKLSWWWDTEALWGYTDLFATGRVKVFYKEQDFDRFTLIYGPNQSPQSWHLAPGHPEYGTPVMIQDIAWFLNEVIDTMQAAGFKVPAYPFSVFVQEMDDYGNVGLMGLLNHYMNISRDILSPAELRSLLAHEYMHYMQDAYISAHAGNIFWMEAHAPLADRMVWNETVHPVAEAEGYLLNNRTGNHTFFEFLYRSWDHWDKSILTQNLRGNVHYCYMASSFLHYMRSYRSGTKLSPQLLLKETPAFQSWINYLDSYIESYLDSDIGVEYNEFIKTIFEGTHANFTLLNRAEGEDPLRYLKTAPPAFMTNKYFRFGSGESPKSDSLRLTMPHLSAQMVQMYNISPGQNRVMVKYKRTSDYREKGKVYLARYDNDAERMVLEDISAVDSSFFMIGSAAGGGAEAKEHVAWLLFVNSDKSASHEVAYDLEILGVPELRYFDGLSFVYGSYPSDAAIHVFNDGNGEFTGRFLTNPAIFRLYADDHFSPVNYSSEMTDEMLIVTASSDWMEQSITYNFKTGYMELWSRENRGGLDPTSTIDIREIRLVLNGVWPEPIAVEAQSVFRSATNDTEHTQQVIESITYSRDYALYNHTEEKHNPVVTTNYIRTNYFMDNIRLLLFFW